MNMPFLREHLLIIISIFILSACSQGEDPVPEPISGCTDITATNYNPSAEVDDGSCLKACEVNQTAEVEFANISNTNSTYDIIWNGSKIATVVPGDTTKVFTVSATVENTLRFQFTNTSDLACTDSNPIFAQCSFHTISCTG